MKFRYILPSTLLVLATVRLVALPVSLASQFDVVVKNNFTLDDGHIHGSSAVGGNVVLNGNKSEFGNNMNPAAGPALVVAGNVVMNTGANVNGSKTANIGSLTLGQSIDSQGLNAPGNPGNLRLEAQTVNVGPVDLDFNAAFDEFALLSKSLADLASTVVLSSLTSGDAQNRTLNLGFTGANNVLNLSYEDFLSIKNIQVGNPGADAGSWIINVDLDGYNGDAIVQNRNGNDDGADLILWNFFGASTLTLQNQFYGTVLAAEIDFIYNGNNLKGQVIASSFTMLKGQVHIHPHLRRRPSASARGSRVRQRAVCLRRCLDSPRQPPSPPLGPLNAALPPFSRPHRSRCGLLFVLSGGSREVCLQPVSAANPSSG